MSLFSEYQFVLFPKIMFYDTGNSLEDTQTVKLKLLNILHSKVSQEQVFSSELAQLFYNQKMSEYNALVLKYKLLKLNTKQLLSSGGARALHDEIQNLYLLYDTIKLNYLRTMGYKKVKVILIGDSIRNVMSINFNKAKDNMTRIRTQYQKKHLTYKNLQRVRTIAGLKKLKLLPYATLNVRSSNGSNKRRMLRRSQVQMIYIDEETNRLLLRYKRARKLQKYRNKTYYMLKEYLKYGKLWARQKFKELYVKLTLKYIDLTSTTKTVRIYDVYDIQTNTFYTIDLYGNKNIMKHYIGQTDLLVTKFGLEQLSKFNNNTALRLVRNAHSEYCTSRYSETMFPLYYLILKINKMKHRWLFKDEQHKIVDIKALLRDYFTKLRLGKNKIIIHNNYHKYKEIKPIKLNGSVNVLFGNNRQKVIGYNYSDTFKQSLKPYVLMLNVPKLKRFKYKLRVVDYQILYNEPAMMSVFL